MSDTQQTQQAAGAVTMTDGQPAVYMSMPTTIRAIEWTGANLDRINAFVAPSSVLYADGPVWGDAGSILVAVIDRIGMARYPALGRQIKEVRVPVGGWLVRGDDDELNVLTAKEFADRYAPIAPPLAPGEPDPRD